LVVIINNKTIHRSIELSSVHALSVVVVAVVVIGGCSLGASVGGGGRGLVAGQQQHGVDDVRERDHCHRLVVC
jgi:hypothetical protein